MTKTKTYRISVFHGDRETPDDTDDYLDDGSTGWIERFAALSKWEIRPALRLLRNEGWDQETTLVEREQPLTEAEIFQPVKIANRRLVPKRQGVLFSDAS